jgi:hypothetical protein
MIPADRAGHTESGGTPSGHWPRGARVAMLVASAVGICIAFLTWYPQWQIRQAATRLIKTCATQDERAVLDVLSTHSPLHRLFETLDAASGSEFCANFRHFDSTPIVESAVFQVAKFQIYGSMAMVHGKDRTPLPFGPVILVYERGGWRIQEFGFPDVVDWK